MTFYAGPTNSQSSYLPVEFDLSEDEKLNKELIEKRQRLLATIVNVKEDANYQQSEILSAQQWFSSAASGVIKTKYGYRFSFDLVALNGGPIGASAQIKLWLASPPIIISNIVAPTHGFGAATAGSTYYFIPSVDIDIDFDNSNPSQQIINVTNSLGSNLTQCYFVFEYLKQ